MKKLRRSLKWCTITFLVFALLFYFLSKNFKIPIYTFIASAVIPGAIAVVSISVTRRWELLPVLAAWIGIVVGIISGGGVSPQ